MATWRESRLMCDEAAWGEGASSMVADQLERRGVRDERVLAMMRRVPRHRFVSAGLRGRAYADAALATCHGQTISQPYVVGLMTEMLGVGESDRVLEVGTGSGYQSAILAGLGASVVSVERNAALAAGARGVLAELGIGNVVVREGDGSLGWRADGPYERIMVTAGAPDVPIALCEQLVDGGRMVIPVGRRGEQVLAKVVRHGQRFERYEGIGVRFVPLVGEQGFG